MSLMPELLAPEWTDKADKAIFLSVVVSGVLILWSSLKTVVEEIKLGERSQEIDRRWGNSCLSCQTRSKKVVEEVSMTGWETEVRG